jgi:outer membrane receptor for ferric coprogen and ferric-rhodotorulic acid
MLRKWGLAGLVPVLAWSVTVPAAVSDQAIEPTGENRIEEIMIHGVRENRTSRGALVLPISLFDTPQSVTILDRSFMDAFGLRTINEALDQVTGVNVEAVETERTYYNSRGFDIKSMQVDGIGLPFNWNVVGNLDTFIYDKVEVIRGANGLLTGVGSPSGTINYIRKRPTNERNITTSVTGGSWDKYRFEGDASTPLNASGSWAGRLVGAAESGDSYLDNYENERGIVSGILEGQVGERTILAFGYSQQNNNSKGVMWGALPMLYSDGEQTDYDDSTSTTMDWTNWDTEIKTPFAEITYAFSPNWNLQSTVTYISYDETSELFYTYGTPDRTTGEGLFGWPGNYKTTSDRYLLDNTLVGKVDAFGQTHEVLLGASFSHADNKYEQRDAPADDPAWGALPSFPGWTGHEIAEPAWGPSQLMSDWDSDFGRLFGVAHINVTDALKLIAGFNAIDVQTNGYSFSEPQDANDSEVSPYIGATYLVTDNVNLYASYSDIYEPQAEMDENFKPLGPAEGKSYEAGVKAELLDQRLLATFAVFSARQDNYAEYGDVIDGVQLYDGVDVESEGFEVELAGAITENWLMQTGFTSMDLKDPHGNGDVRTYIPEMTFNLGTRYNIAAVPGLQVGSTVKWEDDVYVDNGFSVIRQDAHAVLSGFISYAFLDRYEVRLNGYNLTDEKYLASLYWDQAFYAPPINWSATVTVKF